MSDFRKGLPIFLDAVALLLGLDDLPPFRVRIVGGDENEAAWVRSVASSHLPLKTALDDGRMDVWSRVEQSALPELYSRSSVVCMPSLREQFGMVAIESMLCGTPVVGTRVGGLQHIVVHNFTGFLVDRLNPPALASALSIFVRNRNNGEWMGDNSALWARDDFSIRNVASRYEDLYRSLLDDNDGPPERPADATGMHMRLLNRHLPAIERLLGEGVVEIVDVSSSPAPSAVVDTQGGRCFVKVFQPRPASLSCLVRSEVETGIPLTAERVRMAQRLATIPVCPRVVASDEDKGILVLEYLEQMRFTSDEDAERAMLDATSALAASFRPDEEPLARFMEAMDRASRCPSRRLVEIADDAAADLWSATLDGDRRLRKCHPQVELHRIIGMLEQGGALMPQDFRSQAIGISCFLLGQADFIPARPCLCHGSMKRVHLMRRPADKSVAFCDMDHTGLYVGPHDISHWVFYEHKLLENPAPVAMLAAIRRMSADDEDAFLGAAWIAAIILHRAIWRLARGDWSHCEWEKLFFAAFPDAFRKVFIR